MRLTALQNEQVIQQTEDDMAAAAAHLPSSEDHQQPRAQVGRVGAVSAMPQSSRVA